MLFRSHDTELKAEKTNKLIGNLNFTVCFLMDTRRNSGNVAFVFSKLISILIENAAIQIDQLAVS